MLELYINYLLYILAYRLSLLTNYLFDIIHEISSYQQCRDKSSDKVLWTVGQDTNTFTIFLESSEIQNLPPKNSTTVLRLYFDQSELELGQFFSSNTQNVSILFPRCATPPCLLPFSCCQGTEN